jgi:hypothetical protein
MYRHLGWRQRKQQPALAEIDRRKFQHGFLRKADRLPGPCCREENVLPKSSRQYIDVARIEQPERDAGFATR